MSVCKMSKNLNNLMHQFLAEAEKGNALPSYFRSHTVNKGPFCSLCSVMVFAVLCFLLVIWLFIMALKCSAEVMFSVLKCKNAMLSHGESVCIYKLLAVSALLVSCQYKIRCL